MMISDTKGQISRMLEVLARDRARYETAASEQEKVFHGDSGEPLMLLSCEPDAEFADYPRYTPKQVHYDSEKMLHAGLLSALSAQAGGAYAVPSVRANMGCGIVPALFGLKQALFDDKMPWLLERLPKEKLSEMTEADIVVTPEFRVALEHMEYMADACAGSGVLVYPVDVQGAFDTAHLVLGDAIFYEMYDDPEFVHHLLNLCCAAIKLAFDECVKRMPGSDKTIAHYNSLAMPRDLGGLKLSEDTPTLLNKAQVDEFVKPYIRRALASCGGGYVHYCGKNDFLYQAVMDEPLAHGLNFGNPEKHDMERVIAESASRGKVFYGGAARFDGEARTDYFARVKRASRFGFMGRLLLTYSCPSSERDACLADWERA